MNAKKQTVCKPILKRNLFSLDVIKLNLAEKLKEGKILIQVYCVK